MNEAQFAIELNKVERFVKKSTERYDDWDYDGNELKIFIDNECVETYSRQDLIDEKIID